MQVEIVKTTILDGKIVDETVGRDQLESLSFAAITSLFDRHAQHLAGDYRLKSNETIFGWHAADENGVTLTIR